MTAAKSSRPPPRTVAVRSSRSLVNSPNIEASFVVFAANVPGELSRVGNRFVTKLQRFAILVERRSRRQWPFWTRAISRPRVDVRFNGMRFGRSAPALTLSVCAGLRAVLARAHRAPGARLVLRVVDKRPLAVLRPARLQ